MALIVDAQVFGISFSFRSAKTILFFIFSTKDLPFLEFKNSSPNLYPILSLEVFVFFYYFFNSIQFITVTCDKDFIFFH